MGTLMNSEYTLNVYRAVNSSLFHDAARFGTRYSPGYPSLTSSRSRLHVHPASGEDLVFVSFKRESDAAIGSFDG